MMLLPHCDLEPERCGCICEVMENDGRNPHCNECSAEISKEDVARLVLEMESCEATHPRCGKVNEITGFFFGVRVSLPVSVAVRSARASESVIVES
jgi:hypothetical protein